MSDRSAQSLGYIQKFSLAVSGPSGQEFSQFNQAVQVVNEELAINEKTIQELQDKVKSLVEEAKQKEKK